MELLFHTSTQKALEDFIKTPSHSILLNGPLGSGKGSTATYLVAMLMDLDTDKVADHPHIMWINETPSIPIEAIRSAQKFMQLKVPGKSSIRRALVVEQAQTMGTEAQNAFLKLLEEPPQDTVIVLTASTTQQLLPTILSRVQQIRILAPEKQASSQRLGADYSTSEIDRAYYLSEGYMGLMNAILQDSTEHPLVQQIQTAKSLLAGTTYDRLCKVDEIAKQKNVTLFLQALERVCHAALQQAALKNSAATKAWKQRLQVVVDAQHKLHHSPQSKLLLTDLFLHL